jgi:flagellar motor component MotA
MTRDEFVKQYTEIVVRALKFSKKSRREGLLSLEEELDQEKSDNRDVFEYGLRFVIDGTDKEIIEKILSNLINQEKDEDMRILKAIQKEAALMIQKYFSTRELYLLLNSYTDISITEDKVQEMMEDEE